VGGVGLLEYKGWIKCCFKSLFNQVHHRNNTTERGGKKGRSKKEKEKKEKKGEEKKGEEEKTKEKRKKKKK
jgi:hypothetical protein